MAKRSLKIQEQYKEKINNAFISLGLTQKEFAEARLQLSRSTVSNFLRGKPVSKENFIKICRSLKLDWQEITDLKAKNDFNNVQINQSAAKIDNLDNAYHDAQIDTDNYKETSLSTNINTLVTQLREQVKVGIETRCGTMQILDISHPVGLDDIYTKVNILKEISGRRWKDLAELINNCDLENFNRFNYGEVKEKISGKNAVSKYRTLLILGKPGAGKTTFLQHLVIQCSRGKFQSDLVPFFVTLKEFAEAEERPQLLDYLCKYISRQNKNDLNLVVKQGKALICLDGLDEVLAQDSQRVIREIENLSNKYPHNQYLMTCRIAAKEYTFKRFTKVEIADFDWSQITIFANNWFQDKAVKPEIFLNRLEEDKPIQELATNPLLLTLLCLVFEESSDFPGNRTRLYKEGLDALLKKWDAKRGIHRDNIYYKLWTQRKEDLLSKVAWNTFEPGEYFFRQDKAERYIGEYIHNLPGANVDEDVLRLDSEAVLESIETQHGLLVERAKNIYSFSHLTFQEYFTAREIITVRQSSDEALQELVSHLFDKRWREVFLLAVAMSPNAEKLILLMKNRIDNLLAEDRQLQQYLQWLNSKNQKQNIKLTTSDKKIIQKYFILYISHSFTLSRIFYLGLDLEYNLELKAYVYLYRNKNLHLDFNSYLNLVFYLYTILDLCLLLDIDLDLKSYQKPSRRFYFNLNLSLQLAKKLAPQLYTILLELYCRLPNSKIINVEKFKRWWQENGVAWTADFRNTIIKYQDIGHNWQFDERQKSLLEQYYLANQFLAQCLYQECYVTPEVRQEIEETLLLPIAEINKRKTIYNLHN